MNGGGGTEPSVRAGRLEGSVSEVGTLLSELARQWSGRRVEALNGYRRILDDYTAGRADARATANAVARLTAREVAQYPGELVGLASDYASGLARMSGLARAGTAAGPVDDGGRRTVHEVFLAGKVGETVSAALVIENPRESEVAVGIAATSFASETRILKLAPAFEPARCRLAAGGEQRIAVSAKLDGRLVKPGESYIAQAVVDGFDELVLRIHLDVAPA